MMVNKVLQHEYQGNREDRTAVNISHVLHIQQRKNYVADKIVHRDLLNSKT